VRLSKNVLYDARFIPRELPVNKVVIEKVPQRRVANEVSHEYIVRREIAKGAPDTLQAHLSNEACHRNRIYRDGTSFAELVTSCNYLLLIVITCSLNSFLSITTSYTERCNSNAVNTTFNLGTLPLARNCEQASAGSQRCNHVVTFNLGTLPWHRIVSKRQLVLNAVSIAQC
jgi:hypothetical protein